VVQWLQLQLDWNLTAAAVKRDHFFAESFLTLISSAQQIVDLSPTKSHRDAALMKILL